MVKKDKTITVGELSTLLESIVFSEKKLRELGAFPYRSSTTVDLLSMKWAEAVRKVDIDSPLAYLDGHDHGNILSTYAYIVAKYTCAVENQGKMTAIQLIDFLNTDVASAFKESKKANAVYQRIINRAIDVLRSFGEVEKKGVSR